MKKIKAWPLKKVNILFLTWIGIIGLSVFLEAEVDLSILYTNTSILILGISLFCVAILYSFILY